MARFRVLQERGFAVAAEGPPSFVKRSARSVLRATGILPYLPSRAAVLPPKWDYPVRSLAAGEDPIAAIAASDDLARLARQIEATPFVGQSLLSSTSRALLYAVIRAMRPDSVVEIGTFRGGTAEVMARALYDNRYGTLHTVSPHDRDNFKFARWPHQLHGYTKFHNVDSMCFFMLAAEQGIRPGVVLVDGNHDYEFAAFDIWSGARCLVPGGFIFVDNISQFGPYRAVMDFLRVHPEWQSCGAEPRVSEKALDRDRFALAETDFMILRAPSMRHVGRRPQAIDPIVWDDRPLHGLRIALARPGAPGRLEGQCVLRAFAKDANRELEGEFAARVSGGETMIEVRFAAPLQIEGDFLRWSIETWLTSTGEPPLALRAAPEPF